MAMSSGDEEIFNFYLWEITSPEGNATSGNAFGIVMT